MTTIPDQLRPVSRSSYYRWTTDTTTDLYALGGLMIRNFRGGCGAERGKELQTLIIYGVILNEHLNSSKAGKNLCSKLVVMANITNDAVIKLKTLAKLISASINESIDKNLLRRGLC